MARDKRWDLVPMLKYDTKEIKSRISIADAVQMYTGEVPNRQGRIHCPDPNHPDKDPSCVVGKGNHGNSCHCFSCNKSFDVFALAGFAKGLDPQRDFQQLAELVCEDFGIDPYAVSNKGERDYMIQQIFHGDEPQKKLPYHECFPLTRKDLETIGLYDSDGTQEVKFKVSEEDFQIAGFYDREMQQQFGGKPVAELTQEERKIVIASMPERIREALQPVGGKPPYIMLDLYELRELSFDFPEKYAAEADYAERSAGYIIRDGRAYLPVQRVSDLWAADKVGTEEMIMGKLADAAEEIADKISFAQRFRSQYEKEHDVEREGKLLQLYIDSTYGEKSGSIRWNNTQIQRLQDYCNYTEAAAYIGANQQKMKDIEVVSDKMNALAIRRAEAGYDPSNPENQAETPAFPE